MTMSGVILGGSGFGHVAGGLAARKGIHNEFWTGIPGLSGDLTLKNAVKTFVGLLGLAKLFGGSLMEHPLGAAAQGEVGLIEGLFLLGCYLVFLEE